MRRRLIMHLLGALVSTRLACGCRSPKTNGTDSKEPQMSSIVALTPKPLPTGPIQLQVRLHVAWTLTTDGSSHGGGVSTEHRVLDREASSVSSMTPGSTPAATTLRVQYAFDNRRDESEGSGETVKSALAGRSLDLVVGSDGVVTMGAAGGGLSPLDVDDVLGDYPEVGGSQSLSTTAATTSVRIGDDVQFVYPLLRRTVDGQLKSTVFSTARMKYDAKARWVRVQDGAAIVGADLSTLATDSSAWTEPVLELRGELSLKTPEAWPTSLKLAGRARIGVATMAGVQTHEGTIELDMNWTY